MYEMKEEYKIGIDQIDEQHKKLFELADKAYTLLKDEFAID
ncbi:bacteriohemerythrin, partial [Parabacteroides distasonis]|nr:bacteriohemerythrin [Parabacteroides distasonis]